MRIVENFFESCLFHARFITLFAVLGALFSSMVMFIMGTMKLARAVAIFWSQITGEQDVAHGSTLVAMFVSCVDIYLFATVLLIFSIGLYELFISKISPIDQRHTALRLHWLRVSSLDDLKSALGKVVLIVLIVWFLEKSLTIEYNTALDLLYLGVGILLVSGALYLTHAGPKREN